MLLKRLALLMAVGALSSVAARAEAAVKIWDGGGGATTNWDTAANWNNNTVPTSSDTVLFDGTSDNNCTVNVDVTVANMLVVHGYDGTITVSATKTLTISGDLGLTEGLMAYWSFDDNTATDLSGAANDLTLTNTPTFSSTAATLKYTNRKAMVLSRATRQHALKDLSTTYPDTLKNDSWAISAWVNHNATTDTTGGEIVNVNNDYGLRINTAGQLYAFRRTGASSFHNCTSTGEDLTGTGWHHVAANFTGSALEIYVDGAATSTAAACTGLAAQSWTAGDALTIGAHITSPDYDFDGSVDDIRIYNRTISAQTIALLAAGNPSGISGTQTIAGTWSVGNLTLSGRRAAFGSTAMTLSGSLYNLGASTTGTTAITLGAGGGTEIAGRGGHLHALTLSGGTRTLYDDLYVDGVLTMSGGNLTASSRALHVGGLTHTSGTLTTDSTTSVIINGPTGLTYRSTATVPLLRIEQPRETNLLGYWKLDDLGGLNVRDWSASALTGLVANGVSWENTTVAPLGFANTGSAKFDGVATRIDFTYSASTNPITIAAWIYRSGASDSAPRIVCLPHARLYTVDATGKVGFLSDRVTTEGNWQTTATFSSGAWHHIAVTYDGTLVGTDPIIYLDGSAIASNSTGFSTDTAPSGAFNTSFTTAAIGDHCNDSSASFNGYIDDVRIYSGILDGTAITALYNGTYTGVGGGSTVSVGGDSTVTRLRVDSGTLSMASGNDLTVSGTAALNEVKKGAGLTIGASAASFSYDLTVDGTLTMNAASGSLSMASTKPLKVNGSLVSNTGTSTPQPTIRSISGNFPFYVGAGATATPILNIDGLAVRDTDTNGMFINQTSGSSTTFTSFKNMTFSNGTGTTLLQISASSLTLEATGMSFDTANTTNNVKLTDSPNAGNDVNMTIAGTCVAPESECESHDSDDDGDNNGAGENAGSVVSWVRALYQVPTTSGTAVGFPVVTFDWTTFDYHSTYLVYNNVNGTTTDRIYKREADGSASVNNVAAPYELDIGTDDIVGQPRWTMSGSTYTVFLIDAKGKIHKIQETAGGFSEVGSYSHYDGSGTNRATAVTGLGMDTTSLYFVGNEANGASANAPMLLRVSQAAMTLTNVSTVDSANFSTPVGNAVPTLVSSKLFFPTNGRLLVWDLANTAASYITTHAIGDVYGRTSAHSSQLWFIDNKGVLWVLNADSTAALIWKHTDTATTGHTGTTCTTSCGTGTTCACTASNLFVDYVAGVAYWGDKDGHLYAIKRNGVTATSVSIGAASAYPIRLETGSDVFDSAPLYRDGIIAIGSKTGNVYFVNRLTDSNVPALLKTVRLGASAAVSSISYDHELDRYVIGSSNGKLYYVNKIAHGDNTL